MQHAHARHPGKVFRVARASAWVFIPLALAVLTGWAAGLLPNNRLTLAMYNTLVMAGLGSVIVAVGAACQIAIHNAFRAGFETGQASVWPGDRDTLPKRTGEDPLLRLVRDD